MSYVDKPYQPPGPFPVAPPQDATNALGTVSLVLGVMSVFMGCPMAIGALIVGWIGMKREPSGMARAGFILGLVVTVLNAALAAVGVLMFVGLFGLGALLHWAESADRTASSYEEAQFPVIEHPDPYAGMEPYSVPEMPSPYPETPMIPASMPGGMAPPSFPMPPEIPTPYIPPPYVPPPMPAIPSSPFPGPPGYAPPNFGPPGAFPPGAFPPGLGPPIQVEPAESDETT